MRFEQHWTAWGKDGFEFPAKVPGTLQHDYALARKWENLQYGDNIYRFDEIEDWAWTYKTTPDQRR